MTDKTLETTLTNMGFSLKSTLTRDEFDGRKGSAHWEVTVSRNGQSYSTNYHIGGAYRHYYGSRNEPIVLPFGRMTVNQLERNKQSIPNKPELTDVLACLVMDAQSASDVSCFEDWAEESGYDTDSRSAEKTYLACVECFLKLRQLCNLGELSELFQDY